MTSIYIDTSALVTLFFQETRATSIRKILEAAEEVFSSQLLESEMYAVACREKITGEELDPFLSFISLVFPDRSLKNELQKIFSKGYCRGADAHHLACALYLDPEKSHLHFLTTDETQAKLARKAGFALALNHTAA